ncbi:MAG: hypothetical protein U1F83_09810 [Verrucomicrobiota bacterium]
MREDTLKESAVAYRGENNALSVEAMAAELYRQEVLEARRMSPEEKLILGERLFRWACAITLEGIKLQNPGASEAECERILHDRIELGKQLGTL